MSWDCACGAGLVVDQLRSEVERLRAELYARHAECRELSAKVDAEGIRAARLHADARDEVYAMREHLGRHLAGQAKAEPLPCVSGYVGGDGQCNDCGKHHRTAAERRRPKPKLAVCMAPAHITPCVGESCGWCKAEIARREGK